MLLRISRHWTTGAGRIALGKYNCAEVSEHEKGFHVLSGIGRMTVNVT